MLMLQGKTAYYHRKLADTHTRVSPVELSKANGDLSLRQLINDHVVAALRKVGEMSKRRRYTVLLVFKSNNFCLDQ